MLTYWSVPACGLIVLACVRLARLDWTSGLAAALLLAPFAPFAAAGCVAGAVVASRLSRPRVAAGARVAIGVDARRQTVAIPLRGESGSHT